MSMITYRGDTAPAVIEFVDDFMVANTSATNDAAVWFVEDTDNNGSGTAVLSDDGAGGLLLLTTHTTDNDIVNVQANGECFKLAVGKPVSFFLKSVKITDVSASAAFFGLAITDTTVLAADAVNNCTDNIGFLWNGTDLKAVAGKDTAGATWSSNTTCSYDPADGTAFDLEMRFNGLGKCEFYVDGTLEATIDDQAATKTLYPDDEALTPTLVLQVITNPTAAETATVDFVRYTQVR